MDSTPSRVKLHFQENTTELKSIFLSGGEIVDFMGKPNKVCQDIDDNIIEITELIGRGNEGKVFKIHLRDDPNNHKHYVVKRTPASTKVMYNSTSEKITVDRYFTKYVKPKYPTISRKVYTFLNGGNGKALVEDGVIIPKYSDVCKLSKIKRYTNLSNGKIISIPKGNYICSTGMYSEYIISLVAGDLYRSERSINFIDMLAFATCQSSEYEDKIHQFIFMEKIDLTLRQALEKGLIDDESLVSILFQTSFAVGILQSSFQINHNDLHSGNVFLEEITPETMYDGKYISKFTHFRYKYGDIIAVFPRGRYIVKIGDYGFASKWSSPIVANDGLLQDGYGGWMPNFYSEEYDLATLIYMIDNVYSDILGKPNELVTKLLKFILNSRDVYEMYDDESGSRPRLDMLDVFLSKPIDILMELYKTCGVTDIPQVDVMNIGD